MNPHPWSPSNSVGGRGGCYQGSPSQQQQQRMIPVIQAAALSTLASPPPPLHPTSNTATATTSGSLGNSSAAVPIPGSFLIISSGSASYVQGERPHVGPLLGSTLSVSSPNGGGGGVKYVDPANHRGINTSASYAPSGPASHQQHRTPRQSYPSPQQQQQQQRSVMSGFPSVLATASPGGLPKDQTSAFHGNTNRNSISAGSQRHGSAGNNTSGALSQHRGWSGDAPRRGNQRQASHQTRHRPRGGGGSGSVSHSTEGFPPQRGSLASDTSPAGPASRGSADVSLTTQEPPPVAANHTSRPPHQQPSYHAPPPQQQAQQQQTYLHHRSHSGHVSSGVSALPKGPPPYPHSAGMRRDSATSGSGRSYASGGEGKGPLIGSGIGGLQEASPPPVTTQPQQQQASASAATTTAPPAVLRPVPIHPCSEDRPTVALSQNIMSVYQAINDLFYQERERLLAAPVKYAARNYEDSAGHYLPREGEIIADRYVFHGLIGQGSFGKVLQCIDSKYNEPVAVKVIRSGPYFESQGWFEAQVVAHLNNEPALHTLVVQLRKVFLWKGHMVLVFEPLSFSLYKLITLTKYNGVSLDLTRKFAYQIMKVLHVLEQHQPPIIHCDLKPENVLLRDPSRSGVRVIDFGSACYQQQPTWTPPPAQVQLPASSPSRSAGPPWDHTAGTNSSSRNTATAPVAAEGSSGAVVALPTATAAAEDVASANVGEGSGAVKEAHSGPAGSASSNPAAVPIPSSTTTAAPQVSSSDVEVIMPKYIQSRYYRSPEVILELGYTTAIDRWSLGCFLVEMHTGRPLFQGNNEADMMAYFTMVHGALPDYMIAASPKRNRLYHTCLAEGTQDRRSAEAGPSCGTAAVVGTSSEVAMAIQASLLAHPRTASPLLAGVDFGGSVSPLLSPMVEAPGHAVGSPFFLRAPHVESEETDTVIAVNSATTEGPKDGTSPSIAPTPLQRILGVYAGGPRGCRAGQPGHDVAAYEVFCDFIERLLQYDPRKRIGCAEAMQHPFLEPIRTLEARAAAAAATVPPVGSSGVVEADGASVSASAADADADASPSTTGNPGVVLK